MQFKDQVVWITGASSGIGEALAGEFHRAGAKVIISSNEDDELARVKKELGGGDDVFVLPLDLSDLDSLPGKAAEAISHFGQLDIMVNNGGISQRSMVKDTSLSTYRRIIDIDLMSQIAIVLAVLPHFREKKSGHFAVTSSVTGKMGAPLRSGYCAAKHGLHGFYDTLRAEVWEDNIKVTIVCPTSVKTKISLRSVAGDGSAYGKMSQHLDEGYSPEEIAKKYIAAIAAGKEEVVAGFDKLLLAVYIKRFLPGLYSKILRKAKVD